MDRTSHTPIIPPEPDYSGYFASLFRSTKAHAANATSMKLAGLRWLAVIPLVLAIPFLFFGLIWQAVV
jgi:hypothetical protein